mmetsp:Transcript_85771/g.237591  ORF Transcript_85771/g.237591 Transcript_85771/m.237591 type:complete len:95 (+) Transcript_85771:119-403(+)
MALETPSSPPDSPTTGNLPRNISQYSILSGKSGRTTRVDSYGNAIEKGKKVHHCAFPDDRDPSRSVEEKIEVISYKGTCWNQQDTQPGCACTTM